MAEIEHAIALGGITCHVTKRAKGARRYVLLVAAECGHSFNPAGRANSGRRGTSGSESI
jgi:hypothetical protein